MIKKLGSIFVFIALFSSFAFAMDHSKKLIFLVLGIMTQMFNFMRNLQQKLELR